MRIDTRKKIRDVSHEHIIIRMAKNAADMTQVIALNESALELYNRLKDRDFTLDDVVQTMLDIYDVDEQTARADAAEWVTQMRKEELIVE